MHKEQAKREQTKKEQINKELTRSVISGQNVVQIRKKQPIHNKKSGRSSSNQFNQAKMRSLMSMTDLRSIILGHSGVSDLNHKHFVL